MKNVAILFGFWFVAGSLGVACGDSDESGAGGGGTAGTSGASGAAGDGGSGATTGGSAGSATGGASGSTTGGAAGNAGSGTGGATGGTAGTGEGGVGAEGGGNGEGGMGEGGMGPGVGCPATEPEGGVCASRGLSCDFGETVCRCGVNAGTWICNDKNPDCPPMPDPGGECTGMMTACSYGEEGTCLCQNPMGPPPTTEWVCDGGLVMCPASAPADGSSCTMFPANYACEYPSGDCTCGMGMDREWNCGGGGGNCPAMAPMDGSMCMTPGLICPYTVPGPMTPDPTCVCDQDNQWMCIEP